MKTTKRCVRMAKTCVIFTVQIKHRQNTKKRMTTQV